MDLACGTQGDDPDGAERGAWQIAGVAGTDAGQSKFISFAIGDDQYGVDIMAVREIKGWSEVANLPKQPEYVRGVLNLRGVIVPIVDLRMRFGQGMTAATPSHIVMIVQIGQRLVGLLADRVLDIVSIDASKIQPVPKISRASRADFLFGLVTAGSALIALLELPNLLTADEGEGRSPVPADSGRAASARPSMN